MKAEPESAFCIPASRSSARPSTGAGGPLTERVDYLSEPRQQLVYALTVEKLLQLEIPRRPSGCA